MAWNYILTNQYIYLTEEQQENNANEFALYFANIMTLEAMAGVLGNINLESHLNPGQTQGGYDVGTHNGGLGLIQWTPGQILHDYASLMGKNYYDGELQCQLIDDEGNGRNGQGGRWLPTSAYPYSWSEFCALTDSAEACKAYLYERERAGVEALEQRLEYTAKWAKYLGAHPPMKKLPIWLFGSRLPWILGNR